MGVDVQVERTIHASLDAVAAYAADAANAPTWYRRIHVARWVSGPPMSIGSKVAFEARFLRRPLRYTYEIIEHVPGERLAMTTAEGPFPMTTEYTWSLVDDGTRMSLRNHGEPAGFSKLVAPFMAVAMRRAMAQDLRRLAAIVETRSGDA
jgi:hypothetical protein